MAKKKTGLSHLTFVQNVQASKGFMKFVDGVSPRVAGVQPVFIEELFLILQYLWEIYQILKSLGFFKAWFETMKVKRAMRGKTTAEKELALLKVKMDLVVPV